MITVKSRKCLVLIFRNVQRIYIIFSELISTSAVYVMYSNKTNRILTFKLFSCCYKNFLLLYRWNLSCLVFFHKFCLLAFWIKLIKRTSKSICILMIQREYWMNLIFIAKSLVWSLAKKIFLILLDQFIMNRWGDDLSIKIALKKTIDYSTVFC